ncbi:MAG: restriction endonuclease subunit S, partial [Polyangiaceae bacterium]
MSLELRQPLPTSWSKCRLAHIVREMGGSTPSKAEPKFWNGNVPWVSPKDMKRDLIDDSIDHVTEAAVRETALKPVPLGSTLIVVRGMILAHTVPVAQTTAPVTLNQDMKALVPYGVDGAFLRWLLKASQSRLLALVEESGHGTRCLRSELWRALEVAIPPEGGQRAIADFLDEKTAAIDALIEKKERLIALLAEKRAALIHQAVTKGLDPTVPMKPSGIPWIGDIPAHWTRTVVKRGCRSIRDGSHNPPPRFPDGHHRLLSARNIQQGEFILRDDDRRMTADAFRELERSYTVR